MLKRLLMISNIGEGFAQREVQPDLVFYRSNVYISPAKCCMAAKCGSVADIRLEVART